MNISLFLKKDKGCLPAVLVVLFFGLLLRFAIVDIAFIEDETKNVLVANTISFAPEKLNLPVEDPHVTHALLNVYITKLGMSIFGENKMGVRLPHLVFGVLSLLVVYFLAQEMGKREALLAMFLLAVNQYHIHSSIRAENSCLSVFLALLVVLIFWRAIKHQSKKMMLLLGPVCGFMFLAKGPNILIIITLLTFLMLSSKNRFWFRTKALYFSALLFLVVISPWLYWVFAHKSSQLIFQPYMYELSNLYLRRTAINFFLVEPMAWLDGINYRLTVSWEYAIIDGVSGIILLLGMALAFRKIRDDYYKMMFLLFFVVMGVLSFFAHPGTKYGEFWWSQTALIPAICLTSSTMVYLFCRKRIFKLLIVVIILYMTINACLFVLRLDKDISSPPRRLASRVDENLIVVEFYLNQKLWDKAAGELERLLALAPNDIDNHSLLGWIYLQKGMYEEALEQWFLAREISSDYVSPHNRLHFYCKEAIERFSSAVRRNPMDIKARYFLGRLYYYYEEYEQAERQFLAVLREEGKHKKAYFYLGLIGSKKGFFAASSARFQKVIEIDPEDVLAYYHLGVNCIASKEFDKAIGYLEKALSINPDRAETYIQLGRAYEEKGMIKEAQKAYKEAEIIFRMI